MRQRYRLYRRKKGGRYYIHDDATGKQDSLHTSDRAAALRLFALDMTWLPWPVIVKRQWPKVQFALEQEGQIEADVKFRLLKPFAHPERVEISEDFRTMPRLGENLVAKLQVLNEREAYFERIARLRTALSDDAEFRKWLRMPHAELNGETPLRWIERKRWQALADMVDDLLTGALGCEKTLS